MYFNIWYIMGCYLLLLPKIKCLIFDYNYLMNNALLIIMITFSIR